MKDFLARLTSRKFLITVGGIAAVTLYPQYADNIITLIIAYLGAEGAGDVVQRYAAQKTVQTNLTATAGVEKAKLEKEAAKIEYGDTLSDDLNVDKDVIEPGTVPAAPQQ